MLKFIVVAIVVLACGLTQRATASCGISRVSCRPRYNQPDPGVTYLNHGLHICSDERCYYYRYSTLEKSFGGLFVTLNNETNCPDDALDVGLGEYPLEEPVTDIDDSPVTKRSLTCGHHVDGDSCCPTQFFLKIFMGDDVNQTNIVGVVCEIIVLPMDQFNVQWIMEGSCHEQNSVCDTTGYCTISQIQRIVQLLAWCPPQGLGFYPFGFGSHCVCVNPGTGK